MRRATKPLNEAAIDCANQKFYALNATDPTLFDSAGNWVPLSATDPAQADYRSQWMDLYEECGGDVEDTGGGKKKDPCDPVNPCPCSPITSIQLLSVEFLSDHKLLLDYTADWESGGARFPKPEWTPAAQHPVSHSMDQQVEVKVTFEVEPANACPETGTLRGEGPDGIIFEKSGYTFSAGRHEVSLSSSAKLAKKVRVLDFQIDWKADGVSVSSFSPSSSSNRMFVTYDTPYNDTGLDNEVTLKRLEWVCTLCDGDSNGHDSVKKIHDSTGSFDLSAPIAANHWDIAGGTTAQCMDLSKFYMLGTEMLGLRTGEVVFLYPKAGKGTKESTSGSDVERRPIASSTPGHASSTAHDDVNPNEELLLEDFNGGWNNFEACFKFTHPDSSGTSTTRYYAGGADIYDTAPEVMNSVCRVTHWTFEGSGGGWSICTTPGPSPVDQWSP